MVAPWGQVGAHRLDLTHSRQPSLACDSVYLNKVYSYSILSKRGPHRSRNDERTADLTQNFYLPPGAAAGDTVDPVSVFEELTVSEPELTALRASVRDFLRNDRAEFGWQPTVDAWLSRWDEAFSARLGDAGLPGFDHPYRLRRTRTRPPPALRRDRGTARARRSGCCALGGRPSSRASGDDLRHRRTATTDSAADRERTPVLGNRDERAAGRLRPCRGFEQGQPHRRRLDAPTAERFGLVAHTAPTRSWCWLDPAPSSHSSSTLASSQFIVPTDAPGVRIEPIISMDGDHHFQPEDTRLRGVDVRPRRRRSRRNRRNGWHQVTAELSFERSGPERILSTAPLIAECLYALSQSPSPPDRRTVADAGHLLARLISLRQLSISVARSLSDGVDQTNKAALVKDLGTRFEQESVERVADLVNGLPLEPRLREMLDAGRLHKPMFTLRGGTNEVLRGVIARGMGLR